MAITYSNLAQGLASAGTTSVLTLPRTIDSNRRPKGYFWALRVIFAGTQLSARVEVSADDGVSWATFAALEEVTGFRRDFASVDDRTTRVRLVVTSISGAVTARAVADSESQVPMPWGPAQWLHWLERATTREVVEEYGESAAALQSAIDDADSTNTRRHLRLPLIEYDVASAVTLKSDIRLTGAGGNAFNQTGIRASSDVTALRSRAVESGGSDDTSRVLIEHVRINAANNVAAPALHLKRQFLSTFSHVMVSPGSSASDRYGALLEGCDSVRFLDFAWTEFPSGAGFPTLINVDDTNTDIKFALGSFESQTNSVGRSLFNGKGTSFVQVQFERQNAILNESDCGIYASAGGQSNFHCGPRSTGLVIAGLRRAYQVALFHAFATLMSVRARNMAFSGIVDFTRGSVPGVSNTRDRWAVTAGTELLFAVRATARDTGSTGPIQVIAGSSGNDVRAMHESIALDDVGATSYGLEEHDQAGAFLAARANTGDAALSVTSDHWEHARAWKNRLVRGTFRSDAGAFDATGWEYTTASLAEKGPWHASQAWQHPSATFTTSGTALTASGSLTDATVGQYVCVEQSLSGTFTISGTAVTGSGTDFTALAAGDAIYSSSNDEYLEIETITDATNVVLQKAPAANVTTPESLVAFQARKLTAIGSATAGTLAAAFAADVSSAATLKLGEAWGRIVPAVDQDAFALRQDDSTVTGMRPGRRFAMIARVWGRVDMTAEGVPTDGSANARPLIFENPAAPALTFEDGSVIAMIIGEHSYNSLNRYGLGLRTGGLGLAVADQPRVKWAFLIDLDDPQPAAQILSGSATWNPGSIADGDEAVTEVTVAGAELGDYALASFSLDVADLAIVAAVTAADTVTVQLMNNTGGPLDLNSGTVRALVVKQGAADA